MARTVTITMTTTKTLGQIAYEASKPGIVKHWHDLHDCEREEWERIAEAVAKAIEADRTVTIPHVRLEPLTNNPSQPLPAWPGVITTTRPGYQQDGAPSIVCGADGIRFKSENVTINGEASK